MRRNDSQIFALTMLTEFAMFMIVFTVSRNMAESNASSQLMGYVGSGHAWVFAITSVICGRMADRISFRRMIVMSMTMIALGILGCLIFEAGTWPFYLAYGLTGMGSGATYPSIIARLSRDSAQRVGRTGISRNLIYFCFAWNLGMSLGTLVAGSVHDIGQHWIFILAIAAVMFNMLVLSREQSGAIPDDQEVIPAPDVLERRVLSAAFVKLAWLANLGSTFAMGIMFYIFPDLAVNVGISAEHHGLMLTVMRAMVVVTYILMYRSRFWHHRFITSAASQGLAVAGLCLMAVAQTPWGLLLGMAGLAQLAGYKLLFKSLLQHQRHHRRSARLSKRNTRSNSGAGHRCGIAPGRHCRANPRNTSALPTGCGGHRGIDIDSNGGLPGTHTP